MNFTEFPRFLAIVNILAYGAPCPAQPAPPSSGGAPAPAAGTADPTVKARERFSEGVDLAKTNDWKGAYEAFLEAWTLKQHPQIALNLGGAEKELGKYRDASEHLRYCIDNDTKQANVDQALQWLAETKKRIATLAVTVEGDGAQVSVDGKVVGTSPLPPEVYVDPGKHTVEARMGARRARVLGTYEAGSTRALKLLPKEPPPTVPAPRGSAAAPAPPPPSPFPLRTAVLVGGGVAAALGLGVGIAGFVLSADKAAERDEYCEKAADKCLTPQSVDPGLYNTQKMEWQRLDGERVSLGNMGIAGLVVGGIAAAGMGITYFLWKPSASNADAKQGLVVVPAGTGVMIRGNW